MLQEDRAVVAATLVGACLLFAFPGAPPPPPLARDLETYQAVKAKAGKDSRAQVKLGTT